MGVERELVRGRGGVVVCVGGVGMNGGVRVVVGAGSRRDAERLARWHYRATGPATLVRVLTAEVEGEAAGVLCVSMPVLNGSWRTAAWGGRYTAGDRAARARRLNAEVRCISRVIVEPRHRGLGVATALVRAYLESALTERTEAVAVMGWYSGFFERAGMRGVEVRESSRDRALRAALVGAGVAVWRLAEVERVARLVRRRKDLGEALGRWARASRATGCVARGDVEELVRRALFALGTRRKAFVHDRAWSAGEGTGAGGNAGGGGP
jgi:GNAT superfamily N-acetyltransferase